MSIGKWALPGLAALVAASLSIAASAQGLSHWPDGGFRDSFDGVAGGPSTDNDAARFLAQATFGPSPSDIAHLRDVGYQSWLNEQFTALPSTQTHYLDWFLDAYPNDYLSDDTRLEVWAINSVGTPDPSRPPPNNVATDQLRQRIAFALSEIFVVSNSNGTLAYEPWALSSFYDMLAADAFGNYRVLLEDVTKHPAMGIFLSSIQNQKADPTQNIHPDENYAREVMQLFSIGLNQLNVDGTPVQSGGRTCRRTIRRPCAASPRCSPAGTGTTEAAATRRTTAATRTTTSGAARATRTIRRGCSRCSRSRTTTTTPRTSSSSSIPASRCPAACSCTAATRRPR